jgi:hypothetical protein
MPRRLKARRSSPVTTDGGGPASSISPERCVWTVWPRSLRVAPPGMKWLVRGIMIAALVNVMASIWFAQYIINGWLVALYVLGSFTLALMSMLWVK